MLHHTISMHATDLLQVRKCHSMKAGSDCHHLNPESLRGAFRCYMVFQIMYCEVHSIAYQVVFAKIVVSLDNQVFIPNSQFI